MTIEVDLQAVTTASADWADRAANLSQASRLLAAADPGLLSEPVRAAMTAFLDHWRTDTRTLHESAHWHSEALQSAVRTWATTEEAERQSFADLIPVPPQVRAV